MDDQLKQLYDILPNCSCDDFKSAVKKIQSMADDENFLDACLLRAAGHGRLDIISLIYEEFDHPYMGREECFPNCAGETPLLLAAGRGDEKIVKYLLKHKANPFAVDSHGCNAAINAIASGNVELARFLIEDCLGVFRHRRPDRFQSRPDAPHCHAGICIRTQKPSRNFAGRPDHLYRAETGPDRTHRRFLPLLRREPGLFGRDCRCRQSAA